MTSSPLTRKQAAALRFIGSFIAERGYPPTYAELCEGCGLSKLTRSGMHYRVRRLRERGYLIEQEGRVRQSIILSDAGRAFCKQHRLQYSRGSASDPSKPSAPARPLETERIHMGQGARAGIHFRPVEGEA